MTIGSVFRVLSRKKYVSKEQLETSELAKVLTTIDLTALSIGSTLGVGVYVLAGQVAKNLAGPAVILSFLIAAIASVFAGLCYAEFGARVPKAGSAYIYSYVCIGELIAFIIGWNLTLEYVIGAASVVKGMSTYFDNLIDKKMSTLFNETMPMRVSNFADYPDFFAFGMTMVFTAAVAFGARESTLVNNLFTFVNLAVVLFVVISGIFKADPSNWNITGNIPAQCGTTKTESCGSGGFFPYGLSGVIRGAASCFYGFIGFDTIATAGEEAKSPQKSIPLATVISLFVIFLAYFGISTVLTMMLPYYDQNPEAPLPYVFDKVHWPVAKYIVTIGAICGLCSSLFGALFPLPRIIYAMAADGLIFQFLGEVNQRFKTPFLGTFLAGLLTGFMSAIFNLEQLFTMMSIGTLLAYSMVAICVLVLRYDSDEEHDTDFPKSIKAVCYQLVNWKTKRSNRLTSKIATTAITLYGVFSLILGAWLSQLEDELSEGVEWAVGILILLVIIVLTLAVIISFQPVSTKTLTFKVPLVPWIPCLSVLINLYLMTKLDYMTWVRFAVWMAVGFLIYFFYGIRHSKQRVDESKRPIESTDKSEESHDDFESIPL